MKQVIILTQNYMIDIPLKTNLEALGYEVLCSQGIFDGLLQKQSDAFVKLFKIVFFSESISDSELVHVLQNAAFEASCTFRVDSEEPTVEEREYWEQQGIDCWLKPDTSIKELRENIAQSLTEKYSAANLEENAYQNKNSRQLLAVQNSLSAREHHLFRLLCQEKGGFLTRKEVATRLWKTGPTESHLAQLSQLVSRIRLKMGVAGLPPEGIETHWRKGYRISEQFLEKLEEEENEKIYSKDFFEGDTQTNQMNS